MEGQKFLVEICKNLIADPLLWCMYDDHALVSQKSEELRDPLRQAKIMAFARLHLDMFEIVLNEVPKPGKGRRENHSNVWLSYFHDTLSRSQAIRNVLEEEGSRHIWSPTLLKQYAMWMEKRAMAAFSTA